MQSERTVVTAAQDFPAGSERSPKRQERTTEQKVGSARSRGCISLKLARKKLQPPKQDFSEPTIPQPEPAEKSAAGFLIRAALTPFVQHNLQ